MKGHPTPMFSKFISPAGLRVPVLCRAMLPALLLTLFSAMTYAQSGGSVKGTVRDAQNNPVAGAAVTIIERTTRQRRATTTDQAGTFGLERLAAGDYLLTVEAADFSRGIRDFTLTAGGSETADFTLDLAKVSDEVVVTASGTAQTVDETSKAVTVVGAREIALRDEFSLAESLRNVAGINVRQQGGPGALTSIQSRGLRPQDTALLVDGLRLRDVTGISGDATSLLSELFVVNTDRVEVLRGSGSSLYGTNAIGGVINVVTNQGGGRPRGEVQVEGGTLGLFRGRAQSAGGFFADRFVYSGGVAHLNVSNGIDDKNPTRSWSGQGFARYAFTPDINLSARVFGNSSFVALFESPLIAPGATLPATGVVDARPLTLNQLRAFENNQPFTLGNANLVPAYNDLTNRRDSGFVTGALIFSHRVNDVVGYRVSWQTSRTDRDFSRGPSIVTVPDAFIFPRTFNDLSAFNGRTDIVNAAADVRIGRHSLVTVGYEFERENFNNRNTDDNPVADFRTNNLTRAIQQSHTFFIQEQLRLHDDRFQLSLGFRSQKFSLSRPRFEGLTNPYTGTTVADPKTAYTGDGSMSYFFRSTGTKIRAHVGNGYRIPSLYERYGNSTFGNFGDPRLSAERSIATDAGIDQSFFKDRLKISSTYFYTRLQEVIDFGPTPQPDPFGRPFGGYLNTGGGIARGVEVSVQARPTRNTSITAAYTYTNSDNRKVSGGQVRAFNQPENIFGMTATQFFGKRFDLTFDVYAASNYFTPYFDSATFATRVFRFQGQKRGDVVFGYNHPLGDRTLRLYVKVDNFTDRKYIESGFRTPGATFTGGATFRF